MIFVVDTSSALSGIAFLAPSGAVIKEEVRESGRVFDLPGAFRALAGGARLTKVAVATGPGSFTGLRSGVSFGLGLAVGLRIPIVALATLDIQAARSGEEVIAVAEAGRGRVYYLVPGGSPRLAEPADLPTGRAAVGWLRPATAQALQLAGVHLKPESELRSFGEAVASLLDGAPEAPYGSLKIHYMQSFSAGV